MTLERKHTGFHRHLEPGLEIPERKFVREKSDNPRGVGLSSSQDCEPKKKKPPEQQTREEWLNDYEVASGNSDTPTRAPVSNIDSRQTESRKPVDRRRSQGVPADIPPGDKLIGEFHYRGHRTTRHSRLVLEFEHVETGTVVVMFFNVLVESQKTGKKYPTGRGGQFTYSMGHKIHRFLKGMLGAPPSRPSRAHYELRKLKHVNFVGEAIFKKGNETPYWELTNPRRKT